jgi:hypothetical protein
MPLVSPNVKLTIDPVPDYGQLIPRRVWIASCRGMTSLVRENTKIIKEKSPNWDVQVVVSLLVYS